MNINFSSLGSNLWETMKGGLIGCAGLLITNELLQAGSATGFSAKLLQDVPGSKIILVAMAWQIHNMVAAIFDRMGWDSDHIGLELANIAISVIASFSIAVAGSRGNQVAAYITSTTAVCATALLILLGIGMIKEGLEGSYEAIVHP